MWAWTNPERHCQGRIGCVWGGLRRGEKKTGRRYQNGETGEPRRQFWPPVRESTTINILPFYLCLYLFIYWLRWVFIAVRGLSLVAASGGYSLWWNVGFLPWWLPCCGAWALGAQLQQLQHAGSAVVAHGPQSVRVSVVVAHGLQQLWHASSVVVAHRLSCSVACGIFPDQGSNPCPLHWQADS